MSPPQPATPVLGRSGAPQGVHADSALLRSAFAVGGAEICAHPGLLLIVDGKHQPTELAAKRKRQLLQLVAE